MIPWLSTKHLEFPPIEYALDEPNGLLAAGGDLSAERILSAYYRGIFPWFNPGDPILWWSPSPRTVIFPKTHQVSKSLRKTLRRGTYRVTFDLAFKQVIEGCASPRDYSDGTWISEKIISSYTELHNQGFCHSVEVWQDQTLVGGLYGLALGRVFFGESMFSRADNASKVGFAYLVRTLREWDFELIDCQVANNHLFSLGAVEIPRDEFKQILLNFTDAPWVYPRNWSNLILAPWD